MLRCLVHVTYVTGESRHLPFSIPLYPDGLSARVLKDLGCESYLSYLSYLLSKHQVRSVVFPYILALLVVTVAVSNLYAVLSTIRYYNLRCHVMNNLEIIWRSAMNVMQATRQEWRHNTEFMLNLPETEGIAKLYEASHRDSRGDQEREKEERMRKVKGKVTGETPQHQDWSWRWLWEKQVPSDVNQLYSDYSAKSTGSTGTSHPNCSVLWSQACPGARRQEGLLCDHGESGWPGVNLAPVCRRQQSVHTAYLCHDQAKQSKHQWCRCIPLFASHIRAAHTRASV